MLKEVSFFEENNFLYYSTRIGHIEHMGNTKNAYLVSIGRPDMKKLFTRPRHRWDVYSKTSPSPKEKEAHLGGIGVGVESDVKKWMQVFG